MKTRIRRKRKQSNIYNEAERSIYKGQQYLTEKKKELLLQELYDAFTVRNEQSDKPYNVTVSIGACALEPGDEHSLADVLSLADEQLYEVKKLRKKDVAKYRCRLKPQR